MVPASEARAWMDCEHPIAYEPPRLRRLGNVLDVTLGGSPGTGDSGSPTLQAPIGPPI